ncbi:MAG: hypothetical protein A2020_07110 [Lentisphaerae bacterium GWF2_45_14]|nr:MAG: hypothetical protein A2020_07110 [Lentisphaerae bacterium GWF2_45_14]
MPDNFSDIAPAKRKWGFLPILDYYVFSQFMIPLSVLIIGFILLFVIGDIFNDLQDFLESDTDRAKLPIMIEYFILLLPGNIRFILPISVLLSCMYTMANFGKNMEVTAMRASGISLLRCGGSIYVVALIITGINFWFNEQLVPVCESRAETLKDKTTRGDAYRSDLQNMLTYVSPNKKHTWLFKYFTEAGVQKEVMLKSYLLPESAMENRKLIYDIQAAESSFVPGEGWVFKDGTITLYTEDGFMPRNPEPFQRLVKGVDELPETPSEILNSARPPEDLPTWSIWQILHFTKDMDDICRYKYATIFFHRIAFPWSCLIAVFLGIPLAAKNERGGIFKSILSAVAVIIVYQMSSEVFLVLGKQGYLYPVVAGLFPTILFIAYGWYNIVKQNA